MGGYLNRVKQLDFPDLAGRENDDPEGRSIIWVTIRNPRLLTGDELLGGKAVRRNEDGSVVVDMSSPEETFGGFVKLIVAGNVLDPTDPFDDNPAPLPMPPSVHDLAKYPIEILNRIGKEMADSVPR